VSCVVFTYSINLVYGFYALNLFPFCVIFLKFLTLLSLILEPVHIVFLMFIPALMMMIIVVG